TLAPSTTLFRSPPMAQCSPPDMRLPIALALGWPDRIAGATRPCDWTRATSWTFEPLDDEAFPAVLLARRAGAGRPTLPAVYNAANEVCVDAFHDGRIGFCTITDVVAEVMGLHEAAPAADFTLDAVLAADAWARGEAARACGVPA